MATEDKAAGPDAGAAASDDTPNRTADESDCNRDIAYSRGKNTFDAFPQQRIAAGFEAFAAALLKDRSRKKGGAYMCSPLRANGDGRHHRCQDDALPRRWLALDLDGSTADSFASLCLRLSEYQGIGWLTASHTSDCPRMRAVLALSRPVDRVEGIRLGGELTRRLSQELEGTKWDASTHRAEQPCYLPLINAKSMRWDGEPLDVDELLAGVPPLDEKPGTRERAEKAASDDPIVQRLVELGMVKRDHGVGKLSIICPFESQHSEPGGESSTAYLLAHFGGMATGRFYCLHSHCQGRSQSEFLKALGLDGDERAVIETAIGKFVEDAGAVFEAGVLTALRKVRASNPAQYERFRERIKDAGARVVELDRLVCANGGGAAQCSGQGQRLDISDPEPWPERVDGAELLDGLAEIYRRYLVLPAHAATALALWTVNSYAYDYRSCTPCLGVSSPQKRCGKTRLLAIVAMLTRRALPASNITPSAVFRTVDIAHPTLIIDEADTFLRDNEELRGVINSGHTRDLAYVIRLVGEDHEPRKFSTWCPKVIAMIGKLPGTILDRSIVIKMSRRKKTEVIADLAEFTYAEQIRRRCIRWSEDNKVRIGNAKPKVPSELHDRAADNWQSLLALAELAGDVWPERARAAALGLSEGTEDDAHSVMLLHDIRELFTGETPSPKCFETPENGVQIATEDMRAHLVDLEDRPWGECNHLRDPLIYEVRLFCYPLIVKPNKIMLRRVVKRGGEVWRSVWAFGSKIFMDF